MEYNPTIWRKKITAVSPANMNNIENGIMAATDAINALISSLQEKSKVEQSVQNGYIKIDGEEILIYQPSETPPPGGEPGSSIISHQLVDKYIADELDIYPNEIFIQEINSANYDNIEIDIIGTLSGPEGNTNLAGFRVIINEDSNDNYTSYNYINDTNEYFEENQNHFSIYQLSIDSKFVLKISITNIADGLPRLIKYSGFSIDPISKALNRFNGYCLWNTDSEELLNNIRLSFNQGYGVDTDTIISIRGV